MTSPLRRSYGLAALALVLAAISAAAAAQVLALLLGASPADAKALLMLFPSSAVIAFVAGGIGILAALKIKGLGLAWKLAAGQLLVVVVTLINIAMTAALMFISPHDLSLLSGVLAVSVIVSLLYVVIVARWMTASLAALARAAAAISTGALDTRVTITTGDELETVAEAFNNMAERLEAAKERERQEESRRQELIQAVSHDLRTPLAALRAVIDALTDQVVTDEPTSQRYLQVARRETDRLGLLITDLFQLSQIEAGALTLHRELAAIDDLISDVVMSVQPAAQERSVRLEGAAEKGLHAEVDVARIERVLRNLLDNAIAHSPANGVVRIVASSDAGRRVLIAVEDEGPGIAQADLPRVFDRFYRGEASRTRNAGPSAGAGLGLAIARGLVEAHGGTIRASNRQPHGAVLNVSLPASE